MAWTMAKSAFWTKPHKKGNIVITTIGETQVVINVNANPSWSHRFLISHALKIACNFLTWLLILLHCMGMIIQLK
jgi:hypothetical protein